MKIRETLPRNYSIIPNFTVHHFIADACFSILVDSEENPIFWTKQDHKLHMTISNLEIQNTNRSVFIYLFNYLFIFTIFVTMQINDKKTAERRKGFRAKKGKIWMDTIKAGLRLI